MRVFSKTPIAQNLLKFLDIKDAVLLYMGTCQTLRKVGLKLNWSRVYGNSWGHRLKDPRKFSQEIFDSESYCIICGNSDMWTIAFDSGIPLPSKYPYCPRCYNAKYGRVHGIIGYLKYIIREHFCLWF